VIAALVLDSLGLAERSPVLFARWLHEEA